MAKVLLLTWVMMLVGTFMTEGKSLQGFRAELVHVDSTNPSNITLAILRSKDRLRTLPTGTEATSRAEIMTIKKGGNGEMAAQVYAGRGEYLIKMGIGTPALDFYAILDTGSDLTWTQCKPCEDCFTQTTPIFDPKKSSSYSKVSCRSPLCSLKALTDFQCKSTGCEYQYTYGDFSLTMGILSYETFTFGSGHSMPSVAFGCGTTNEGNGFKQAGGIAGFGRGALSFISQLPSVNSKRIPAVPRRFSYCLVRMDASPTKSSPLFLGRAARLERKPSKIAYSTTPILTNPKFSTFYYLDLEGISIGSTALRIPKGTFGMKSDGSGGMIIDSGTTITYLKQAGYDEVRKRLSSLIRHPTADGSAIGLDLCYSPRTPLADFPNVVFHFKGADFVMGRENYMVKDKSGLLCLAMLPNDDLSILGNVQQQNFHILYDVDNSLLSFQRASCDSL